MNFLSWSRRAVTLMEVVVVVAALAVLLAFLLPSLQGTYRPAKRATCKSHLSDIGKGTYFYSLGNGGFYPFAAHRPASNSLALLYPDYVPEMEPFTCPSTQDSPKLNIVRGPGARIVDRWFDPKPAWSSYGYDSEVSPRTASALQPIAADMDGSSVAMPGSPTANHQDGQNVLFYDTHVDWKSPNTWSNAGVDDNMFTAEFGGGDTDTFIRR